MGNLERLLQDQPKTMRDGVEILLSNLPDEERPKDHDELALAVGNEGSLCLITPEAEYLLRDGSTIVLTTTAKQFKDLSLIHSGAVRPDSLDD